MDVEQQQYGSAPSTTFTTKGSAGRHGTALSLLVLAACVVAAGACFLRCYYYRGRHQRGRHRRQRVAVLPPPSSSNAGGDEATAITITTTSSPSPRAVADDDDAAGLPSKLKKVGFICGGSLRANKKVRYSRRLATTNGHAGDEDEVDEIDEEL